MTIRHLDKLEHEVEEGCAICIDRRNIIELREAIKSMERTIAAEFDRAEDAECRLASASMALEEAQGALRRLRDAASRYGLMITAGKRKVKDSEASVEIFAALKEADAALELTNR